jgi:hypothetical protein
MTYGYEGMVLFDLVDTSDSFLGTNDLERLLLWLGERLGLDHANRKIGFADGLFVNLETGPTGMKDVERLTL